MVSISGDNVQENPYIGSSSLQAPGSASDSIRRWPIQRGSDEAGPSRPVRSCHATCPVHCPLHPSFNLQRVQSYGGIPRFDEWLENFGGGLKRPVRALPILPDPENPNANDKKGRRVPWFKKSWFKKPSWFKK